MMNTLPLLASAILLCTQVLSSTDDTYTPQSSQATLASTKAVTPALPTMSDRKPSKKLMTASSPALRAPTAGFLPAPERWTF